MTLELMDAKITEEEVIKKPDELMKKKPGKNTLKLREHSQEFIEMIYSRIVDNSIEQILKVDSIEALLKETIESKVSELSNKGFGNIEEWCLSRGIPLVVDKEDKTKIVECIAIRNIIVHNRCYVDEKYTKAVPDSKFMIGSLRELEVNDLYSMINILTRLVTETDHKSIAKFSLQSTKSIKRAYSKKNFNFA